MRLLQKFIMFIVIFMFLFACNDEDGLDYLLPKTYLPAYPGSYWDYTNGQRVKTDMNYQAHQYEEAINTTTWSSVKMVPLMDGRYVYEYSIYQNSTVYPLKQLLKESKDSWEVDKINNELIMREVISINDTLLVSFADSAGVSNSLKSGIVTVESMYPINQYLTKNPFNLEHGRINNRPYMADPISTTTPLVPFVDTTVYDSLVNVIVVVEYMDSLGKNRWNEKEYYAKNIGLVRKEVNNPYDNLDPVIVKQIHRYFINK